MKLKTNELGDLGEILCMKVFIEHGWAVYNQFSGKAPFDFVAYKAGKLLRISAKCVSTFRRGSSHNTYVVQLKNVHMKASGAVTVDFNKSSCDLVCAYLREHDTVVCRTVGCVTAKNEFRIRTDHIDEQSLESYLQRKRLKQKTNEQKNPKRP